MDGQVYARIESRGSTTTIELLPSGAVSNSRSSSLRDDVLLGNWRAPLKYMFSEEDLRGIPWGAKVVPWGYVTEFVPEQAKKRPAVSAGWRFEPAEGHPLPYYDANRRPLMGPCPHVRTRDGKRCRYATAPGGGPHDGPHSPRD